MLRTLGEGSSLGVFFLGVFFLGVFFPPETSLQENLVELYTDIVRQSNITMITPKLAEIRT